MSQTFKHYILFNYPISLVLISKLDIVYRASSFSSLYHLIKSKLTIDVFFIIFPESALAQYQKIYLDRWPSGAVCVPKNW